MDSLAWFPFWRLLAGETPHASQLEYFKRNLANAVSIDLATWYRSGSLLHWPGVWAFGCFLAALAAAFAAFQQIDSTIIETDMWLICTEDCSAPSAPSAPEETGWLFGRLSFGLLFPIFFSVYFLPVAGWQSGTVLCAINFPTVSHSSPGPATLLDTIFDSIRFDCLTCGLDIYFHTHSTVCACGWRGSAARYRKCYFWLLFMRHDEATPRSLPVPFPISRRDRWPKRENNNDVGGWRLGRWMDRSLDGESVTR